MHRIDTHPSCNASSAINQHKHMHVAGVAVPYVDAPISQTGKETVDTREMATEERLHRLEQEATMLREEK